MRAVLLDPGGPNGTRWIRTQAEYADTHHMDVVCVAADLGQALAEITTGRADVLIVPRTADLHPLIHLVTEPVAPATPDARRPRRLK